MSANKKRLKQVPIRIDVDEWQLLHRFAEPGGIQQMVRDQLEPLFNLLRAMDARQRGQSG